MRNNNRTMAQSKRKINRTSFDDTGSSDETTSNEQRPAYTPGHRHKKQKNSLATPQTPQEISTANTTRPARPQTTSSRGRTSAFPGVDQSSSYTHPSGPAQPGNNEDDAVIISDDGDHVSTFESSNPPIAISDRNLLTKVTTATVAPGARPSAKTRPSWLTRSNGTRAPETTFSFMRALIPDSDCKMPRIYILIGFPPAHVQPDRTVDCYHVAYDFPNSLYAGGFDAFIRYGFTALQIFLCLAPQAVKFYASISTDKPTLPIRLRLNERITELKRKGTYELLMNEPPLREDGRHAEILVKPVPLAWITGEKEIPKHPSRCSTIQESAPLASMTSLPGSSRSSSLHPPEVTAGELQLPVSEATNATPMLEGTEISPSTPTASEKGKGKARAESFDSSDSFDGADDWQNKVVYGGRDESESSLLEKTGYVSGEGAGEESVWDEKLNVVTASNSVILRGPLKGLRPGDRKKKGTAHLVGTYNVVKPRAATKKPPATNEEPRVTNNAPDPTEDAVVIIDDASATDDALDPTEDTVVIIDDASATDDEAPMFVNEASDFEDDTLDPEYKVPITSNILSDDEDEAPIATKRPRSTTKAPLPATQTPVNASEPVPHPLSADSEEPKDNMPPPEVVDASVHRQVLDELERCKQLLAFVSKARQDCHRDLMTERKERVGDQSEVRKLYGEIRQLKDRLGI